LRMPWLPVGGLIVAVLAVFAALFISGTQDPQVAAASTNPFPTLSLTPVAISADAAAHGEQIYLQSCAACHGLDGMGVENLGNQLRASEFLASNSDEQLLAMIRAGRELNDPANTSGLVMPPSGGRPDLSDADILAIIQYLRAE
ncbi:MAG: cytochrome c, partial [Caldilinea sp.]|nr:cytochrome c [Caldilinea sp.]